MKIKSKKQNPNGKIPKSKSEIAKDKSKKQNTIYAIVPLSFEDELGVRFLSRNVIFS
jgi:hypothetical protein